ncbi:MAG: hypothetical protein WCT10_01470 [Patescibacteria group bacterium]|jgi:hypothetical protein
MELPIGIDLDGTIIDHTANKQRLAADLGYRLTSCETNSNIMSRFMSERHYEELQERLYKEMTLEAPPVRGALEVLSRLGRPFFLISARRPETIPFAQAWIDKWLVRDILPPERTIFCGSGAEKRGHCDRLGVGLYLDDKVGVLQKLSSGVAKVWFDEHGLADALSPTADIKIVRTWVEFGELLRRG